MNPILHARILLSCLFCVALGASVAVSSEAAPEDPALQAALAAYEEVDARMESRIDDVLGALTVMEDSRASGQQVIEMKRSVLRTLGDAAAYYQERIDRLSNDLRAIDLPAARDDIARQIRFFYGKLDQRISDIVAVTESLARQMDGLSYLENNEEVRARGGTTPAGGAERDHARNAALLASRSRELVDKVTAGLAAAAADLETRTADLSALADSLTDPELATMVETHLDTLNRSVNERMTQLAELDQVEPEAGIAVGNKEAQEAKESLATFGRLLREDFQELDRLREEINRRLMAAWQSSSDP